jgi:hypothetical protein
LALCDFSVSCHFYALEVIEAESQALRNTLTEHNFHDAFKEGRSTENGAYALKGSCTSRMMMASRP